MSYRKIAVAPIAGALGAEVAGVDLGGPPDNQTSAEIHRAFAEFLVLFFRDQQLDPAQQLAFSARFGRLMRVPYIKPLDDHPEIIAVLKAAEERDIASFGGDWHSDFTGPR